MKDILDEDQIMADVDDDLPLDLETPSASQFLETSAPQSLDTPS